MWKCKVCAEKDKRIADLNREMEFFKRMLRPSNNAPIVDLEANKILDGAGEEQLSFKTELTEEEIQSREDTEREATAILTGNY